MRDRAAVVGTPSRRTVVAVAVSLIVLTLAVTAGLLAPPTGGAPVILVDRLSSEITNALSGLGGRVLLVYAFLLGAATVFNPCGFGLIPAYLGLYLGDLERSAGPSVRLRRSIRVGGAVATAFTVLFGATGAVFSFASRSIIPSLPWLSLVVGIALVGVGARALAGRRIVFSTAERAADALGRRAGGTGTKAYAAFGVGYALASLGCSFPLFFALVGTSMATGTVAAAIGAFVLFGIGMAAVLTLLAVVAGIAGTEALRRGRVVTHAMSDVGAALVLLAGGYVVYYWLSAGRLLLR